MKAKTDPEFDKTLQDHERTVVEQVGESSEEEQSIKKITKETAKSISQSILIF